VEPNYQLKRLSVAAMMQRRATPAEARLIRFDLTRSDKSARLKSAAGIEPLWLMNERARERMRHQGRKDPSS
jgi:hypothetical protein